VISCQSELLHSLGSEWIVIVKEDQDGHVVGDLILVDGVGPDHTPGKFAQQIRDMFAAATIDG
jgi:hypothetical protein